jgi:hypothetical protein
MIDKKGEEDNVPEEISVGQTIELKEEKKGDFNIICGITRIHFRYYLISENIHEYPLDIILYLFEVLCYI